MGEKSYIYSTIIVSLNIEYVISEGTTKVCVWGGGRNIHDLLHPTTIVSSIIIFFYFFYLYMWHVSFT